MLIASMCSKAYRKVIVITTTVVVHTGAAAYMTVRLVVTRDFEFLRRGIDYPLSTKLTQIRMHLHHFNQTDMALQCKLLTGETLVHLARLAKAHHGSFQFTYNGFQSIHVLHGLFSIRWPVAIQMSNVLPAVLDGRTIYNTLKGIIETDYLTLLVLVIELAPEYQKRHNPQRNNDDYKQLHGKSPILLLCL